MDSSAGRLSQVKSLGGPNNSYLPNIIRATFSNLQTVKLKNTVIIVVSGSMKLAKVWSHGFKIKINYIRENIKTVVHRNYV